MNQPISLNPYASVCPVEDVIVVSSLQRGLNWLGIEFELTQVDLGAFFEFHYLQKRANRRAFIRQWLFISTVFLLAGVVCYSIVDLQNFGLVLCLLGAVALVGYPSMCRSRVKQLVRATMSSGRNIGMQGTQLVRLTKEGVHYANPAGRFLYFWNTVEAVCESKSNLLIYVSGYSAIIIPRRAFSVASDYQELLEMARNLAGPET